MRVLVTGAGGFVGQALVRRLLAPGTLLPRPLQQLVALDRELEGLKALARHDRRLHLLPGDFGDPAVWPEMLEAAPQWVFHLASLPGSRAEQQPALGLQVNLLAPQALLHRLAEAGVAPRVVFASSVAVYGALPADLPASEQSPTAPMISYGAHKLMTEILLADLSRRGVLDGLSLRLPGIVARPPSPTGHGSAFMSDLIRRLAEGVPYECPVSAQAQAWWMSLPCCVDNLLHAARLPAAALPASRTVQLPVITATTGALVAALEARSGRPAAVTWRPDARTEALFGRLPVLHTPQARALGFVDDGSLQALIAQALAA